MSGFSVLPLIILGSKRIYIVAYAPVLPSNAFVDKFAWLRTRIILFLLQKFVATVIPDPEVLEILHVEIVGYRGHLNCF